MGWVITKVTEKSNDYYASEQIDLIFSVKIVSSTFAIIAGVCARNF